MTEYSHTDLAAQYQALAATKTLVIIHSSAYAHHHRFKQYVLQNLRAVYVNLQLNATLEDTLASIDDGFQEQCQYASHISDSIDDAGEHLAETLVNASCDLLYLDGYDGNTAQAIEPIIVQAIKHLRDNKRIILSGRRFPGTIYNQHDIMEHIGILQVNNRQDDAIDYAIPSERTVLEVRAFGDGHVWMNGQAIDTWEGHLPRTMFFYFVDKAITTRDNIFNEFWPELSVKEATNVFHVTKRKVHEILGTTLVVYTNGYYRLSPDIDLYYDAVQFQETIQQADVAEPVLAAQYYRSALDHYRHDFLSSIKSTWAIRRREEMRHACVNALLGLATLESDNNPLEAQNMLIRANAMLPTREDVVRALMISYTNDGNHANARAVFERLQEQTTAALEQETQQLANKILRNP